MIRLTLIAVLSVSLVACKDKKSKKEPAKQAKVQSPDDDKKKAKKAAPAPTDRPFADALLDAMAGELVGHWVIKASALVDGAIKTQRQAWDIRKGEATLVSTDGEATGPFELVAPCRFKFSPGGDAPPVFFNFVKAGGELHIGVGRGGVAIGDDVVACTGDGIFVIRDGKCTGWKQSREGEWSQKSEDCSLTGGGNGFKLGTSVIPGDGKVFADGQLQQTKAKSFQDYGAAKAAVGVFPE